MKANAPEKIYLEKEFPDNGVLPCGLHYSPSPTDIEYTRTDAFIEKADEFIGSFFHPDDTELRNCLLKKFHEYMKGE